ncbi:MAG: chemotaxis protein CheB [Bacteroidia bacterium]
MRRKNILPEAVVIGGSAGSLPVINKILASLNEGFPWPIIICVHRMKNVSQGMNEVFSSRTLLKVIEPNDKEIIQPGFVYLAPSNYHLLIENQKAFSLCTDRLVNYSRPSIDITLSSASHAYGPKLVGILLSGANKDGAQGLKHIKQNGGVTIVQDPDECMVATMPFAAIELNCVDHILNTEEIINYLITLPA